MADAKNTHPATQRGIIGNFIELILKIIGLLLFSALISIVVEWISMAYFQEEATYRHAEQMMQTEIGYLSESLSFEDGLNNDAIGSASDTVSSIVTFLFIDSGLVENLMASKTPNPSDGQVIAMAKGLVAEYYEYLMAAIYILAMFFIRMAILILSMPAFLLFGVVGICDGLMQRDLRRWSGGNESGYIYHWAKRFAMPVLALAWILYLSIPNSIHPNYLITPFAVLFGMVLMVMFSKFKKYL